MRKPQKSPAQQLRDSELLWKLAEDQTVAKQIQSQVREIARYLDGGIKTLGLFVIKD